MSPSESKSETLRLYEKMLFIRFFEENLFKLFDQGILFGTTHTSLGQEALAVALAEVVDPNDIIFSNHRCHGHYIAITGDATSLLLEIMGRVGGICEGYGGSQHIQKGRFYSNGIQGGYVPIVAGMAYAEKVKETNAITVGIIGDGTMGEGAVYEGLNMMGVFNAPALIIIENNRYAQSTKTINTTAGTFVDRARAFGIHCHEIETNDVFAIVNALQTSIKFVRENKRPFVFIHHTYRLGPHSKGDDNRPLEEINRWRENDPLILLEKILEAAQVDDVRARVSDKIVAMTAAAKSAKFASLKVENFSKESSWKENMYRL